MVESQSESLSRTLRRRKGTTNLPRVFISGFPAMQPNPSSRPLRRQKAIAQLPHVDVPEFPAMRVKQPGLTTVVSIDGGECLVSVLKELSGPRRDGARACDIGVVEASTHATHRVVYMGQNPYLVRILDRFTETPSFDRVQAPLPLPSTKSVHRDMSATKNPINCPLHLDADGLITGSARRLSLALAYRTDAVRLPPRLVRLPLRPNSKRRKARGQTPG